MTSFIVALVSIGAILFRLWWTTRGRSPGDGVKADAIRRETAEVKETHSAEISDLSDAALDKRLLALRKSHS